MYEKFKRHIQPLINIYHLLRAVAATVYYGYPSSKLRVIGVTGTDGKTTTTHAIYHILKSAGKKVSMLSTVYAKIGDKEYETGLHVTTPDAVLLQKLLSESVKHGDEYFVLETTSHGLDQNRNFGIFYEIGVITNITHEHLDYHITYEKYLLTKAKLLKRSKIGIINRDDTSFEKLKTILKNKIKTYGLKNDADYKVYIEKELKKNIPEYNRYNFLAAYSVCLELGIDKKAIFTGLKTYELPIGRFDLVHDGDFKVYVDFAHTPNALASVLPELKKESTKMKGRLIHVFGSAGLRDASKRSMMGAETGKYADISIVTEEDYRTEDPEKIYQEIIHGIDNKELRIKEGTLLFIMNRQQAINHAIKLAKKGDVVVCTGKAHEKSLNRNGVENQWDEFLAVENAMNLKK
ncbi:MAG: Mur ligase family protein [Microgenomates group bacterium]|nr:UDP-N-acetylmuramoyl-L-alanyl-D-glutamate--2,6-diaminopimelate ligase [Candidatus Woesebacteria bacterium]MBP6882932.1 UDP-N-acetylmuramoyl-L-alanyl-D-glutamate--2,6-diaminopimelate ligase [Candidatus Woesebacteria bacterium]QQR63448.1 MAG: UDP-N-acetylmuramoyl-L-alanyl-D-glutamate--2,6-diaminopimelate ligase [Candidatus Roizmanbacteria bacterium]